MERLINLITKEFDYDETNVNIYDEVIRRDLSKIPKLYRESLTDPNKFIHFLENCINILKKLSNGNFPVYKNLNIFHLLCFATFHLSKFDQLYSNRPPQDTAELFLIPLKDFIKSLYNIISQRHNRNFINVNPTVTGFCTPYTYLILTSYISRHLNFHEIPSVVLADNFEYDVDILEEIFKPLLTDNDVTDIYQYDLRKFNNDSIITVPFFMNTDNAHCMINLDLEQMYHKPEGMDLKDQAKIQNIFQYVQNIIESENLNLDKFLIIIFLNKYVVNYLYDIDDHGIIYDDQWSMVFKTLKHMIKINANLQNDLRLITHFLFSFDLDNYVMQSELFIDYDESTIFMPLVFNDHFDVNGEYIKAVIKKSVNTKNSHSIFCQDLIIGKTGVNKDLLLTILEEYFDLGTTSYSAHTLDNSPVFDLNYLSYSLDHEDSVQLDKNLIDIITILLKFIVKKFNKSVKPRTSIPTRTLEERKKERYEYFRKIYAYKESLFLKAGINLDEFGFDIYVDKSPVDGLRYRSLDNSLNKDNIIEEDESEKTLFGNFHDKKLMTKLIKIYKRTVQQVEIGDDKKCDMFRIFYIQKYLSEKYKPKIDYIYDEDLHEITVERDKEFETLYVYWRNILQEGDLNVKFKFTYSDSVGVDYSAVTSKVFLHAGEQLRENYLTKLSIGDSPRYILKYGINDSKAFFIGKLMSLFIIYNIHLDFNLSIFYLGHMMFTGEQLSYEEQFLYYILDLYNPHSKEPYKHVNQYLDKCKEKPMKIEISEDEDYVPDCVPKNVVEHYLTYIYQFKRSYFKMFMMGFFIQKKLFMSKYRKINDKIRIYDMDKLISQYKFTTTACKKYIFDKLLLSNGGEPLDKKSDKAGCYRMLEDMFLRDKDFDDLYNACSISEQDKAPYKSKENFCKAILMFWTSMYNIDPIRDYSITIYDIIPDGTGLISANACFNNLNLPLPDKLPTKQAIYDFFMNVFISGAHLVLNMA